eukprot:jgi/Bigna1/84161/fgenesh1_pg.124_\
MALEKYYCYYQFLPVRSMHSELNPNDGDKVGADEVGARDKFEGDAVGADEVGARDKVDGCLLGIANGFPKGDDVAEAGHDNDEGDAVGADNGCLLGIANGFPKGDDVAEAGNDNDEGDAVGADNGCLLGIANGFPKGDDVAEAGHENDDGANKTQRASVLLRRGSSLLMAVRFRPVCHAVRHMMRNPQEDAVWEELCTSLFVIIDKWIYPNLADRAPDRVFAMTLLLLLLGTAVQKTDGFHTARGFSNVSLHRGSLQPAIIGGHWNNATVGDGETIYQGCVEARVDILPPFKASFGLRGAVKIDQDKDRGYSEVGLELEGSIKAGADIRILSFGIGLEGMIEFIMKAPKSVEDFPDLVIYAVKSYVMDKIKNSRIFKFLKSKLSGPDKVTQLVAKYTTLQGQGEIDSKVMFKEFLNLAIQFGKTVRDGAKSQAYITSITNMINSYTEAKQSNDAENMKLNEDGIKGAGETLVRNSFAAVFLDVAEMSQHQSCDSISMPQINNSISQAEALSKAMRHQAKVRLCHLAEFLGAGKSNEGLKNLNDLIEIMFPFPVKPWSSRRKDKYIHHYDVKKFPARWNFLVMGYTEMRDNPENLDKIAKRWEGLFNNGRRGNRGTSFKKASDPFETMQYLKYATILKHPAADVGNILKEAVKPSESSCGTCGCGLSEIKGALGFVAKGGIPNTDGSGGGLGFCKPGHLDFTAKLRYQWQFQRDESNNCEMKEVTENRGNAWTLTAEGENSIFGRGNSMGVSYSYINSIDSITKKFELQFPVPFIDPELESVNSLMPDYNAFMEQFTYDLMIRTACSILSTGYDNRDDISGMFSNALVYFQALFNTVYRKFAALPPSTASSSNSSSVSSGTAQVPTYAPTKSPTVSATGVVAKAAELEAKGVEFNLKNVIKVLWSMFADRLMQTLGPVSQMMLIEIEYKEEKPYVSNSDLDAGYGRFEVIKIRKGLLVPNQKRTLVLGRKFLYNLKSGGRTKHHEIPYGNIRQADVVEGRKKGNARFTIDYGENELAEMNGVYTYEIVSSANDGGAMIVERIVDMLNELKERFPAQYNPDNTHGFFKLKKIQNQWYKHDLDRIFHLGAKSIYNENPNGRQKRSEIFYDSIQSVTCKGNEVKIGYYFDNIIRTYRAESDELAQKLTATLNDLSKKVTRPEKNNPRTLKLQVSKLQEVNIEAGVAAVTVSRQTPFFAKTKSAAELNKLRDKVNTVIGDLSQNVKDEIRNAGKAVATGAKKAAVATGKAIGNAAVATGNAVGKAAVALSEVQTAMGGAYNLVPLPGLPV